MGKRKKQTFYAVAAGRKVGVFNTWEETEKSVKGFKNSKHESFLTLEDAEAYIEANKPVIAPDSPCTSSAPDGDENLDTVHIYTDGACKDNGKRDARAGIGVFWGLKDPRNVSERLDPKYEQTNNRAEIHAAVRAIRDAKKYGYKNVTIHTDSQFMINCITKWMKKWVRNHWKTVDGLPVTNKEDLKELWEEQRDIEVEFKKVKAHSGNIGNNQADQLAKAGVPELSIGERTHKRRRKE